MTDYNILPEDILSDFLRVRLTDPRARAEATETQTFTPAAAATVITLASPTTGKVQCVTGVTIDGVSTNAKKWRDYFWDSQNAKLTFFSAFAGTETVVVTYKYGTVSWIYGDKPDTEIHASNFPRINIWPVAGSGKRLGQYDAPIESSQAFQIDVFNKDDYSKSIGGQYYGANYLAGYLAHQITKFFADNESDMFPLLYNYEPIAIPRAAPYEDAYQAYHVIIEANFKGIWMGRIVK